MNSYFSYRLSNAQKKALIISIIVSILIQVLPLAKYISQIYSTVSHELGHALTAWMFGYIAIPKLDFFNGGGVTQLFARPLILIVLSMGFVLINLLVIKNKFKHKNNKIIIIIFTCYLLALVSPIHLFLITFMGKAGELLFFYFVAWYSLSHQLLKIHGKALIYLILAIFLWINSVLGSFSLIYNSTDRLSYIAGKQQFLGGDPLVNDLVKLSQTSGFSFDFFNFLLLTLALFSMHRLLKINDQSILDNKTIKSYGYELLNITKLQFKIIKNLASKSKEK